MFPSRTLSMPLLPLSRITPAFAAAAFLCAADAAAVDFERDVAPILEARCLSCHDEQGAEGGIRLDLAEFALDSIVPGQPDNSELISQIAGPEPRMPKEMKPLSGAEVETLRQWIAEGADWPADRVLKDAPARDLDWWSLQPLVAAEPPAPGHPVDAFLNAELEARGLTAVAPADAATLLRRVRFDLTGLPPTPEELNTFTLDEYETLVDSLLASPDFGEKWARHWLDLARYADTHGYDKDKPRENAWPYRDFVIDSLNQDMPYDEFARRQIAGDVLYPDQPAGVLGLGFLAAGPWDFIGHVEVGEAKVDGRIAKHLDRDEMIAAVFNVFTATTVQCAQCHHHKFDPVTTYDYYRLHAVFAAVDREDRVFAPPTVEQAQTRERLLAKIGDVEAEIGDLNERRKQQDNPRIAAIQRRLADLKLNYGLPAPERHGWHSAISAKQDDSKWVQVDLGRSVPIREVRLVAAYDEFNGIGEGFGFPLRFRVETCDGADFTDDVHVLFDAGEADFLNPLGKPLQIDGGVAGRFVRVTATKLAERKGDFIFALGELEVDVEGEPAAESDEAEATNAAHGAEVTSSDSIEALPRWSRRNLVNGIFYRPIDDPDAADEYHRLQVERVSLEARRKDAAVEARLAELNDELRTLKQSLSEIPAGRFVYAASTNFDSAGQFKPTGGRPRDIRLLHRGDIRSPGEPAVPGMPPLWPGATEVFALASDAERLSEKGSDPLRRGRKPNENDMPPKGQTPFRIAAEDESGSDDRPVWNEAEARAALALAITDGENPLFWRVIANRLWQWTFGRPLVDSPNDFGRMGMQPTHPQLLDYLAARLRDDPKHSLKTIVRLLVTSDAYRRSSAHHAGNAAIDSGNTFLWRADPRRLTAEECRDAMLAAAGVLRLDDRGGPGFRDFVISKPEHSPHYEYERHDPDDVASHRRSIYRFAVRSQPQPFLTALDCADPSISVPGRDESTTAVQALAQWNNRFVEAMSRHLGRRLADHDGDKTVFGYRLVTGRHPDDEDAALLSQYLGTHGEANLARVLLNLNSFLYLD